jgi:hypothetical protein
MSYARSNFNIFEQYAADKLIKLLHFSLCSCSYQDKMDEFNAHKIVKYNLDIYSCFLVLNENKKLFCFILSSCSGAFQFEK